MSSTGLALGSLQSLFPWTVLFLSSVNPHHPHEDRTRRPNDPNETKATTMAEMVMTYLTKAQDLVPATYGYYALVSALCVVLIFLLLCLRSSLPTFLLSSLHTTTYLHTQACAVQQRRRCA